MTTTNPFRLRSSRPARLRHALVLSALVAMSLSACGGAGEDGDQDTGARDASASAPSPSPSPASGEQPARASDGTPIRITFGATELTYGSDAPFFNGIVRIGELDGDTDALERQSEDFSVTIERAE